jgi:hypothetical protein
VQIACARDLLRDFERDGLEVYNSLQTNLGAALAALNHLEDSLAVRPLQANVRVAAAQIEERGPRYSRSAASSYSRSRSEHPRQRRRSNGPLEPVAEEGRGEKEVCSRSIPLPTLQLMLQLILRLALRPMLQPTSLPTQPATSPTTQPMMPTSRGTPLQTQGKMQELNLRQCRLIVQKVVSKKRSGDSTTC